MKTLKEILADINILEQHGPSVLELNNIAFDSRQIEANSMFAALVGTQVDGHEFIEKAIKSGAVAILCQEFPENKRDNISYIRVKNSNVSFAKIASNFYNSPSKQLKLIGITGTNGKTTIASLLFNLYRDFGYKTGLISTIENRIEDQAIDASHTTPDALQINKLLSQMVAAGISYCFMEVSSHAIDQDRIEGLYFSGGVFSNITHDHLDYHKNFAAYITAKKKFFDGLPKNAFALTNLDDKRGQVMLQNTLASKYTYGLNGIADFSCKIIENQFDGLQLSIEHQSVWFKLIGKFNAYNLMAIYATAVLLGEDKLETLAKLSNLETADGRFEQIKTNTKLSIIIDYAHTPDALENVLDAISSIRTGNEQLITVVGAGGNRDKTKRPIMAQIACSKSDRLILTSDNPRFEDPNTIIEEMRAGLDAVSARKVLCISNRKEAIKTAIALAKAGDIILIAGKGHEKYQVINGENIPFDEKKIIEEALMN